MIVLLLVYQISSELIIQIRYKTIQVMIHGHKKQKQQKTAEEIKQEEELSDKINSKLTDFFVIRSKPFTNEQIPKYLQFTALLMQLCSDISTIFNFRRQIILKYIQNNQSQQAEILVADIKLTTKLIKDDPKSYTLWSYRQWLIQKVYKLNPKIIDQEKNLCKMLLMKDQKNFHVWNYRNWINSIQFRVDQELSFTQQKIKVNPFNFSPYHFRSKYLPEKYLNLINNQSQLDQKTKQQILSYGMPKINFDQQLQKVKTAMFLNPNQEAPWIYYRWLIRRTLPILILKSKVDQNFTQLIFNEKIQKGQLQRFISSKQVVIQSPNNSKASHTWQIKNNSIQNLIFFSENASQTISRQSFMQCQSSTKQFVSINSKHLMSLRSFYQSQIKFINQIQQEQENCRFALFEHLQLIKLILLLGTMDNKQLFNESIAICQKLLGLQNVKTKQYIEQLLNYWKNAANTQNWTVILK